MTHSSIQLSSAVEWSSRADFSNLCGSREVSVAGTTGTRVLAAGLTRGRRYFFRAAAGNIKGWGPFTVSLPRSVVPSSEYQLTNYRFASSGCIVRSYCLYSYGNWYLVNYHHHQHGINTDRLLNKYVFHRMPRPTDVMAASIYWLSTNCSMSSIHWVRPTVQMWRYSYLHRYLWLKLSNRNIIHTQLLICLLTISCWVGIIYLIDLLNSIFKRWLKQKSIYPKIGPTSSVTQITIRIPGWRDVSSRTSRGESGGAAQALEVLTTAANGARTRPPTQPPRLPRKKTATIRQLFTAASKFQKNLRR